MQESEIIKKEEIEDLLADLGIKEMNEGEHKYGKSLYKAFNKVANITGLKNARDVYESLEEKLEAYKVPFFVFKDRDDENVRIELAWYYHEPVIITRAKAERSVELKEVIETLVFRAHSVFIENGLPIPENTKTPLHNQFYLADLGGEYAMRVFLHNLNVQHKTDDIVYQ